jgi:hypothetical protein
MEASSHNTKDCTCKGAHIEYSWVNLNVSDKLRYNKQLKHFFFSKYLLFCYYLFIYLITSSEKMSIMLFLAKAILILWKSKILHNNGRSKKIWQEQVLWEEGRRQTHREEQTRKLTIAVISECSLFFYPVGSGKNWGAPQKLSMGKVELRVQTDT